MEQIVLKYIHNWIKLSPVILRPELTTSPVNLRTPTSEKMFSMLTEVSLQIYVHLVGTNAQKKKSQRIPSFLK